MFKKSKKEEEKKKPSPKKYEEPRKKEKVEGQKYTVIDEEEGRAEIVEEATSIPYVEKYGEDTQELEESVLLKDGKRDGLLAQVKLIEDVEVIQDHDANIESIGFNGKLNIENPSKIDRLWDIDLVLKNIEQTSLDSNEIIIQELGTSDNDNVDSHDFKIKGEAKNLLLVKEYINTLPNADDILNIRDIENDLLNLKDKSAKAGALPEKKADKKKKEEKEEDTEEDEEEDDDYDGGAAAEEYHLESFGISKDKELTVTFAIGMRSLFEKPLYNVQVKKKILGDFTNAKVTDTSIGSADVEGDQIIWKMDELNSEETVLLKFTCNIMVSEVEAKKTGEIEVTYEASSSFVPGFGIDKFDAYTRNKFHIDIMERDEEPGVWDCKLVFENTSEFIMELFDIDLHLTDDASKKFVPLNPEDLPLLPPGAQWHTAHWDLESEDYPKFKKSIEFRVLPNFQTKVNSTISIKDVELVLASMMGTLTYDVEELDLPVEEEEGVIKIPTYQETDINAILTVNNDGSAPLNELKVQHKPFNEPFLPPNLEETTDKETGEKIPLEVQVFKDGKPITVEPGDLRFEDDTLIYDVKDLKNRPEGMFDPDSAYEFKYPVHAVNPVEDAQFETDAIINANTYPIGPELEYIIVPEETPIIKAVHLRRQYRLAKEIIHMGELGHYKIILHLENITTTHMPLKNFPIIDKIPENFKQSNFSMKPQITDFKGEDILKWEIPLLEEGKELDITYEIKGEGDYHPSDAHPTY